MYECHYGDKCLINFCFMIFYRVGTLVYPSFVEFDMSAEGFGCLFLPSMAPQSAGGGSVVGAALSSTEPNVIGGIGTGMLKIYYSFVKYRVIEFVLMQKGFLKKCFKNIKSTSLGLFLHCY